MPILKKTLFDEHLEKYNVLVNDIQPDSEYFKITELPDTFTGGKNAFLIQGSAQLVADTLVKIQIRDAKNKIIYYEPGMGIPQYYEGTSKVIGVYIYPDTAFGPCTITILGELSEYVDSNGINQPVPQNWQGTYNVKWTKTVNVNPRLANITKVRFYKRPKISITESILPIYTRTTNIITISGSMNGTAINPQPGTDFTTFNDVLQYQITLTDGTNFSSSMVGETYNINGLSASYSPTITQVLTNKTALVNIPYYTTSSINPSYQNVQSFTSGAYTASFIQTVTVASSNVSSSFASIDITDLDAFTGNPHRIKVYASSLNDVANFSLLEDVPLEASQIFLTSSFNGILNVPTGYLSPSVLSSFWNYFNIDTTANISQDNNLLYQSAVLRPSSDFSSSVGLLGFYYNRPISFSKNTEYELDYTPLLSASAGFGGLSIYGSGSAFLNTNSALPCGKLIGNLTSNQSFYRYDAQRINFKPDNDGTGSILFVVNGGTWQLANLNLAAAQDTAFSPNEVKLTVNVPTKVPNETYDFKFEIYDVNNNFVPVSLQENFTFVGGNDTITSVITNVSSSISSSFGPLSSSFSGSLAQVSSSISGTITYNSSSVSGSIVTLSGSVSSSISSSLSSSFNYTSGSIYTLSASVSQSNATILSSSLTQVKNLANGNYSGSFISGNIVYAPVIGGQTGYFSQKFQVGQTHTITLDATNSNTSSIYIGTGNYNNTNTPVYMDSSGQFSLGNQLTWNGTTLNVSGVINITGGNAATTTYAAAAASNAVTSGSNYAANAATSASNAQTTANNALTGVASVGAYTSSIFTSAAGAINKAAAPSGAGLYLGSSYLGYYDGSGWKTYMASTGNFYLAGSGNNGLTWNSSAGTLTIDGQITARSGYIGNGSSGFTINNAYIGNGKSSLSDGNNGIYLGTDGISLGASSKFKVDSNGNLTASSATISGAITATSLTLSAGVTISNSQVSGLGSLATANGVSTSQVSGLGSLATLSSIDTSYVTGLGLLATRNSVNSTYIDSNSITTGLIASNTIVANNIGSLAFYGKSAQFDTGDIGGWTISGEYLGKDVGAGSGYGFKLDSTNKRISITNNSTGIEKVRIDPSDTIPTLITSYTDTVTLTGTGQQLNTINASTTYQYRSDGTNIYVTPTSGRSDNCSGTGYNGGNGGTVGVIGLIYPNEEIWVDTSEMTADLFNNCINIGLNGDSGDNDGYDDYVYARYTLTLRVKKYANCTDAGNDTNVIETYLRDIAYLQSYVTYQGGAVYNDSYQFTVNDCAVQVDSQNNYFRIDFQETTSTSLYTGGQQFQTTRCTVNRFNGDIIVRFGRVDNGYSIFSPGGLQVYQGVKAYLNASSPTSTGANFFEVKGKSAFLSGLYVSGTFSAENKQFQITHPLNEKKWLYHTSIEAPKAELIYRGVIELENGIGSASIDNVANMTMGTFEKLSRNPQIFLQNNESFDRIKGRVESGSVYVLCENQNSTASIDWTVIAERYDQSLLNTNSYNNGRYIIERYKSAYADEIRLEIESKFNTGSI